MAGIVPKHGYGGLKDTHLSLCSTLSQNNGNSKVGLLAFPFLTHNAFARQICG